MEMNEMLLQMVYAASQIAQNTLPQTSAANQPRDEKDQFQTLLKKKRDEAEKTEKLPAQDGQEKPETEKTQAGATQTGPVQTAVAAGAAAEGVLFQAAAAETVASGMAVVQMPQGLTGQVGGVQPLLTQTGESAQELADVVPAAPVSQEQSAMPEAQAAQTTPKGEMLQTHDQSAQQAVVQPQTDAAAADQPAVEAPRQNADPMEGEVLQAQAGSVEQPLFQETDSMPQRVGDAPVLDTQAEEFDTQMSREVTSALKTGQQHLELRLTPENLGSVVVEMSRSPEGLLHVVLHTESEQAAKLLSEHSSTLGLMLQSSQQGEVRVEVQRPETDQRPWQQPDQNGGQNSGSHNGRGQQEQQQNAPDPERFLQQLRLGLIPAEVL